MLKAKGHFCTGKLLTFLHICRHMENIIWKATIYIFFGQKHQLRDFLCCYTLTDILKKNNIIQTQNSTCSSVNACGMSQQYSFVLL